MRDIKSLADRVNMHEEDQSSSSKIYKTKPVSREKTNIESIKSSTLLPITLRFTIYRLSNSDLSVCFSTQSFLALCWLLVGLQLLLQTRQETLSSAESRKLNESLNRSFY